MARVIKNREEILKKARNKLLAIKLFTVFAIISGALILLVSAALIIIPDNSDIQLSPLDTTSQETSLMLILTSLILLVSLFANFFLYVSLKNLSDALLISNQNIDNINKNQTVFHEEDIKEIATTRDLVLYKLISNNKKK